MIYFKTEQDEVIALEDDKRDFAKKLNFKTTEITEEEALQITHPPLTSEQEKELQDAKKRSELRHAITEQVADVPSLVGTTSDAAAVAIDHLVFDVLAVERSANSSYKTQRKLVYEELHGAGEWASAVAYATQWLEGRKSGVIKSTVDVKGAANVFAEVAQRATAVAQLLEDNSND